MRILRWDEWSAKARAYCPLNVDQPLEQQRSDLQRSRSGANSKPFAELPNARRKAQKIIRGLRRHNLTAAQQQYWRRTFDVWGVIKSQPKIVAVWSDEHGLPEWAEKMAVNR